MTTSDASRVQSAALFDILTSDGLSHHDIMIRKEEYVSHHHPFKIYQTGDKRGKCDWRTYIEEEGGNRKRVQRKTREDLTDYLFDFYFQKDHAHQTLSSLFDQFIEYKESVLVRNQNTIVKHKSVFRRLFDDEFQERMVCDVSEGDLRIYLKEKIFKEYPSERTLNDYFQLLHSLFKFALSKHYIPVDISEGIREEEFISLCDRSFKSPEDEIFSDDEWDTITRAAKSEIGNVHARAILLATVTGMRAGEIAALKWSDIDYRNRVIHIRRQQVKHASPHVWYENVEYTKDTQKKLKTNGRQFPLRVKQQEALSAIREVSDSGSEFVIQRGEYQLLKDSYEQYLHRFLVRNGISPNGRNNHAIRKTFNSKVLIPIGLNVEERALLLGHSAETNEKFYSFADLDVINKIGDKFI